MIKTIPSAFASFFRPISLDSTVARWAFEGGFFIEVGLLDGSYLDVISLHPVNDNYNSVEESSGVRCREWGNFALYLLLLSLPCICFYLSAMGPRWSKWIGAIPSGPSALIFLLSPIASFTVKI